MPSSLSSQQWKTGPLVKPTLLGAGMNGPLGIMEKSREPLPYVLQTPEEQTDNWDDDFEEGISLTKLHGVLLTVLRSKWC